MAPSSVNSCTWPWTGVWGSLSFPKHLHVVTWIEFHKEGRDERSCRFIFLEESRIGVRALNREVGVTREALICYGADGRH